jgi:exodeoxyribonuclease VII small subunit
MSESKSRVTEFEKSLAELEALVGRMESGELSLEDSMKQFERGIQLARACQQMLKQAELKVQQLVQKNGQAQLEDFAGANDEPGAK